MTEPVQSKRRSKLLATLIPLLSILLVCYFPCGFLFFQNAGEARLGDTVPFFTVFLLTAVPVLLVLLLVLRNLPRAAFITDLALLAAENFTLICNGIKSLIPGFQNRIFLVAVGLILLGLTLLLLRRKPNLTAACGLLLLGFGSVLLINLIPALPTFYATARNHRDFAETQDTDQIFAFAGEKRNVYFCVFDEYPGPESLQYFYGESNEPFLRKLEDEGFQVSRTSRNTESVWTATLVPNILNLDYVADNDMPVESRLEWMQDPALYRIFRGNGYQINLLNHHDFFGDEGCRVLTSGQSRDTISMYLYRNSIFCQIPRLKREIERIVLHWSPNRDYDSLMNMSEAFRGCWRDARGGPTLTMVYFQCPHTPFVVDAEGRPLGRPEAENDWRIPELYLGQVSYINGVILESVAQMRQHDPDAVILLLSDHGARTAGHLVNQYGGPMFDTEEALPYMQNVLCAVYAGDKTPEIEGDTCINAVRKTLDSAFGLSLGQLEVPHDYALTEKDCFGPYWGNG